MIDKFIRFHHLTLNISLKHYELMTIYEFDFNSVDDVRFEYTSPLNYIDS